MNAEVTNIIRDDQELVKAFQSGNKMAFDELVLRHKDRVFNICYRFMGEQLESEDCAQDVFLKVYRSLKRFRFESSFYTWLYRITVNTCKNRLKSSGYRGRKRGTAVINPDNNEDYQPMERGDEDNTPMGELEKMESIRLIQNAIDTLPVGQKEMVILRDVEGLSYEEITKITGYRLGTLKSKLSRARHVLRERLRRIIQYEM